jgi:hypothetical protein
MQGMSEPRYLLMVQVDDDGPNGPTMWGAASLNGSRVLTAEQVEVIAGQAQHRARFVLPYTEQTEDFGAPQHAPTLAMMPGENLWQYGEPTRTDSMAVLRTVADGAESPDPRFVLVPVAAVVGEARKRFGMADAHDVEVHFDALALSLDAARVGEPPAYRVELDRLLA